MLNFKISETEDYEKLVPFFIENELEFSDPLRPIEPEDILRADRMMYAESLLALAAGLALRIFAA